MFKPVSSRADFPGMEGAILRFWEEKDIFARSVRERPEDKLFVLYEGPPTANASPGIHHVLARAFKDVIPRYKTMKGYRAPRKGGWDTHGLPVELEVERALGFKGKREIEDFGVAQFNRRCRESVLRYVQEWEALTKRIAFWVDMSDPYITCHNDYIESCWWIVKQLWDKGLLSQDYRVTPHCPRCVTSLSDHEVALGYEEVDDPSVYVRFRLSRRAQPSHARAAEELGWNRQMALWREERPSFLAWTTTPWTLTGNVALAVAPQEIYALVETRSHEGVVERLILAKALLDRALGRGNWEILKEFSGSDLTSLLYERLYEFKVNFIVNQKPPPLPENMALPAVFVSMEEGTGIVHIAPAFGEEDYQLGLSAGLPLVQTVDLEGKLRPNNKRWDGKFVKEADPLILDDLKGRGLLYRQETIRHTYPFCWRCGAPLLYYAKASWYIRTTARKAQLIADNRKINWFPEHIKEGRFGEWLENNVDWAVSRERYWGTPLPVWRCQGCGHQECLGSRKELTAKVGLQGWEDGLDLHRPYIDQVTYACPKCGGSMQRLPEVLDAWFDSGAMPVAQWHYPFQNQAQFRRFFPADYICEAVDQTRGWFYTLHALSTLLFDRPCFKNVICLGHIQDAKGEKMSKSKGNVVEPWFVIDSYGADALRWYLYTASPPGSARRFSGELVAEVVRKFLLTLWNTYAFLVTYANIDRFDPRAAPRAEPTSDLDRWILSELHLLIADVDARLEGYDPTGAARRIQDFVDDLSNWYVRRSRRRFWKSENDADKLAAHATLYRCLTTLAHLLAPFTPFLAEEMYQNLVRSGDANAPESVHLASFPEAEPALIDRELTEATRLAMKLASLGRAARSRAGIKVRQPLALALALLPSPEGAERLARLASQLRDELNVKDISLLADESQVLEYRLRPNLALLGPKYGGELPRVRAALGGLDPGWAARALREEGWVEAGGYRLSAEEIVVEARERAGFALAREAGYLVAVSTEVTPELAAEGLARELVHRLQTMRKSAGFDIADYIVTYYRAGDELGKVIRDFAGYIQQETLSRQLLEIAPPGEAYVESHRIEGQEVTLGVRRAGG